MSTDNLIGTQLGEFVIRELIGKGGMASVFRAYQHSVNRDVALKVILLGEETRHDENFRRRFTREAEIVAGLEHIHILPVYDYGFTDDVAYLAMRLLRGGTLADLMRHGALAPEDAANLFRQFASALAYAHRKGVIHRDLKPANVMLDDAGNALLTDFGLAKVIGDSGELTQQGTIVGTPHYMSPEQLRGRPLDHRSDIYSTGVVLYQMMTGRCPFGGPTSDLVSTIYQQLEEAPPPPRTINPAILPDAELVILRALRKDPDARYSSMEDMADDLDIALGLRGSSSGTMAARMQATESLQAVAVPRRLPIRALAAAAVGLVALLAALVVGLLVLNDDDSPEPVATRRATVRLNEIAGADQAVPTPDEIAAARRRLGEGFVALITCTLSTDYHAGQAREIGELAASYGLPFRIYDSDADSYRQITLIEAARAEGATALVVCPLEPATLDGALSAVEAAGLPLVQLHSDSNSYGGVLLAGDDYQMGLKAGRFAGQIVAQELDGQARVLILDYPGLPILVTRANGLEDGLHELAPQAEVVTRARGGTREFAQESVGALLDTGERFDVILSINDAGSLGAIAALEAAGIGPEQVIISSIDAEVSALDYIREGRYIRGSLAINRLSLSQTAVNALVKLLAGSTLPETFVVPPGDMVTRETLESGGE